jgi:hypothetical protein
VETDGKEGDMFSAFLKKPFASAIEECLIPNHLTTIAGTWGAVHDTGELTYMNLGHLAGIDGADPDSMTRGEVEGRKQAMLAIEALRHFMLGCKGVRLRNFGMTIGICDTRRIDAIYNLTEADVRRQGRLEDTIGIYTEFIDGCGALDPCHVGVAFGMGAGKHRAGGGDGFDQLTLFAFKCQLGSLNIDDFVQAFGLGQRGRDVGRGRRSTTLVAAGGIKAVFDSGQPLGHVDLTVGAHRQPLCHQLRPLVRPTRAAKAVLLSEVLSLVIFVPRRWRGLALCSSAYKSAQKGPPLSPSLPKCLD